MDVVTIKTNINSTQINKDDFEHISKIIDEMLHHDKISNIEIYNKYKVIIDSNVDKIKKKNVFRNIQNL